MVRRRIRRVHFAPMPRVASVSATIERPRIGRFEHISKVFGASPAIVFDPLPPIASITRPLKARVKGRGDWLEKIQAKHGYNKTRNIAMMLGRDCDHVHGYDDGEAEPQSRGIH